MKSWQYLRVNIKAWGKMKLITPRGKTTVHEGKGYYHVVCGCAMKCMHQ